MTCPKVLPIWLVLINLFVIHRNSGRFLSFQLEATDTTKYLGIDLSYNLSWNHHIDRTVKKGNSMLGFLKRNLKISNQDTKSPAYFSLVRPYLEYCASIWNPYSIQSIKKPEMVQRRTARYATTHYKWLDLVLLLAGMR
jgi:hypothetical protein